MFENKLTFNPSTYIVDQNPTKYGGQQEDYKRRAAAAIEHGLKKLNSCEKTEASLTALFYELLQDFGKARQEIALSNNTFHAEQFGRRRDTEGQLDFYQTFFDDVYRGYNQKILKLFAEQLKDSNIATKEHPKVMVRVEESHGTRTSSFEIEVFENEELIQMGWIAETKDRLPANFPSQLLEKREREGRLEPHETEILKQAFQTLKKEHPEIYKRNKMLTAFKHLNKQFPSPKPIYDAAGKLLRFEGNEGNLKSFFALGTARVLIDDKLYATSQYLVWLYRDKKNSPLKRMLGDTTTMFLHQDRFLIPDSLKKISKLFVQAVLANRQDLKELKDRVALFRFYSAHAMADERGSASKADMFETMIYHFHGFALRYNNEKMVDLEALTMPLLPRFMKDYDSMVELRSIT